MKYNINVCTDVILLPFYSVYENIICVRNSKNIKYTTCIRCKKISGDILVNLIFLATSEKFLI